jgi:hypothetical protein
VLREVEDHVAKDKGKFEDMAKVDKVQYERNENIYFMKGKHKRNSRIPMYLWPFPCSVLSIVPKENTWPIH